MPALHLGIVVFVVGGLAFIVAGGIQRWPLARSWPFRIAHLAAIAVVVAQAWLGAICPLTTLESWLRVRARQTVYSGSFVEHWVGRLLYHDAPPWAFTVAYTLFGLAVLGPGGPFRRDGAAPEAEVPPRTFPHPRPKFGGAGAEATGRVGA